MPRLYRYVGPAEIAAAVRDHPAGLLVRSKAEVREALASLGSDVCTYVIDAYGALRLADRSSEHVACAAGGPVLTAGEVCFEGSEVVDISNQSTGFCPESSSWHPAGTAFDRAGIAHPGAFTASFEFRRCRGCGARSLIKDDVFECFECGHDLPPEWSFDRTRCHRFFAELGGTRSRKHRRPIRIA